MPLIPTVRPSSLIGRKPGHAAGGSADALDARGLFLELLLPVQKNLYNFIRKTMSGAPEADDLFQDTLIKGFRYFRSYDRGRSFKTWLFTIAHNLMKDYFVKEQKRKWSPLEDAAVTEMAENGTPGRVHREVDEIYTVARQLPPRRREVFFLYYYNGFSVPEIAGITGLSRANIKFILHRARRAVKDKMEVTG